jgi:predicted site-specific integrase-resolvase
MTQQPGAFRNIGYARVSKVEQHLELQLDALKKYGCVRIFTDTMTGTRFDRKELIAALAYLNAGDTLVVWRLDRLGRSLKQLFAHKSSSIQEICKTPHISRSMLYRYVGITDDQVQGKT